MSAPEACQAGGSREAGAPCVPRGLLSFHRFRMALAEDEAAEKEAAKRALEAARKKAEEEAETAQKKAEEDEAAHYFDSSGINGEDMMKLDTQAPPAIKASVAQFQFYSLREKGTKTIVSACATKSSRNRTLSIVWIATRADYRRHGFAKHLVEYIHTKAAEDGFTRIMVLLTHYS